MNALTCERVVFESPWMKVIETPRTTTISDQKLVNGCRDKKGQNINNSYRVKTPLSPYWDEKHWNEQSCEKPHQFPAPPDLDQLIGYFFFFISLIVSHSELWNYAITAELSGGADTYLMHCLSTSALKVIPEELPTYNKFHTMHIYIKRRRKPGQCSLICSARSFHSPSISL